MDDMLKKFGGGGTEEYQKPSMEIVELNGENVITASCTGIDATRPGYGCGSDCPSDEDCTWDWG